MKNFTKQNFKTNPLWIRLLIMTFMLLVGSSSAWAVKMSKNVYVYDADDKNASCGNKGVKMYVWNGDWNTTFSLTSKGNKVYEYTANNYDFSNYIFHFTDWCSQTSDLNHNLDNDATNCYYVKNGTWDFHQYGHTLSLIMEQLFTVVLEHLPTHTT